MPSVRPLHLVMTCVALLLMMVPALHAAEIDRLSFAIDCTGFSALGGSLVLDRDNTGQEREAFVVSASDGTGSTIYTAVTDSALVGTRVTFNPGQVYAWTGRPSANPLTLAIVSLSGNGEVEQEVARYLGTCTGLDRGVESTPPTDPIRDATGAINLDGPFTVSPAVLPNQPIPVPRNNNSAVEQLRGYGIVNIDNLYMRSGDSPRYSVVAVIDGGTRLVVLGRNDDFTWWFVQVGEIRGWVKDEFLLLRGDLTDVPVLEAGGAFTLPTFLTFLPRDLRDAPTLGGGVLCELSALEHVITGRDDFEDWYLIDGICADGRIVSGWVSAEEGVVRNPAGVAFPVID